MYNFSSRIRYSEVNSEGTLTLQALMDYLQDCCSFQSEDLGVGVEYLKRINHAWVLSSWEIVITQMPQMGDNIRVNTWPYNFKGFYGCRNFTIEDESGRVLVAANSLWVFMDLERMRPARISAELLQAYQDGFGAELEGAWGDRKIEVPAGGEHREPVPVAKFFIDTNHHMNNSKYVTVAQEFLPEDFVVGRIRVEYKKAAMLGDVLYPVLTAEQGKVTVVLAGEEEAPYAVVEFIA